MTCRVGIATCAKTTLQQLRQRAQLKHQKQYLLLLKPMSITARVYLSSGLRVLSDILHAQRVQLCNSTHFVCVFIASHFLVQLQKANLENEQLCSPISRSFILLRNIPELFVLNSTIVISVYFFDQVVDFLHINYK